MATGMIQGTFHVGGLTSLKKGVCQEYNRQNVLLIFISYIRDILNGIFTNS